MAGHTAGKIHERPVEASMTVATWRQKASPHLKMRQRVRRGQFSTMRAAATTCNWMYMDGYLRTLRRRKCFEVYQFRGDVNPHPLGAIDEMLEIFRRHNRRRSIVDDVADQIRVVK